MQRRKVPIPVLLWDVHRDDVEKVAPGRRSQICRDASKVERLP